MTLFQCTVSCGGGVQQRTVKCMNIETSETEDDSMCVDKRKPPEYQKCNLQECRSTGIIIHLHQTVSEKLSLCAEILPELELTSYHLVSSAGSVMTVSLTCCCSAALLPESRCHVPQGYWPWGAMLGSAGLWAGIPNLWCHNRMNRSACFDLF